MAYDEALAGRIRRALMGRPGITEMQMFGGLVFFRYGKMLVGIAKRDLVVRVGPERYGEALAEPHARPMDLTGRPMKGYVFVESAGCRTDRMVLAWVQRGVAFVSTLEDSRVEKKNRSRSARSLRGTPRGDKPGRKAKSANSRRKA